jgi:hypothetical protein
MGGNNVLEEIFDSRWRPHFSPPSRLRTALETGNFTRGRFRWELTEQMASLISPQTLGFAYLRTALSEVSYPAEPTFT